MGPINISQNMTATLWTILLCLLGGVFCTRLFFLSATRPKYALSPAVHTSDPTSSAKRGVRLTQVKLDRNDADTDIDIIAIHGLDTTSRDTWTWNPPGENDTKRVNWLHPGMLPESVERARIWTCDWPADLLEPSDLVPKTLEEYALLLLDGIERDLFENAAGRDDRSIVFIASCLGGIILMRALVRASGKGSTYCRLRRATRGIVFLATPFRGTSFQDVAAWAEPGLKARASIQGQKVSTLLDSVKGSTFDLEDCVRKFTQLCQDKDNPYEVFNFYELQKTSLPLKAFPWLPGCFHHAKQLVDKSSATLDMIPEPLPLDRRHSLMNKFHSPECADYKKVAGKIKEIVGKIRAGTPLERADVFIRNEHYNAEKLQIERLSGDLLPMDQCYINLAIVDQSGRSNESDAKSSPLSLFARQKVETPDKDIEVKLPTIFNERKRRDGRAVLPRRVLIRGRAGVGKTTLCKKIVHEFSRGAWGEWTKMFDRVLWVPLRNLRLPERRQAGYNFEHLFRHEYFSLPNSRPDLAIALSEALATKSNKTLFLLDGLDEVSQDLGGADAMSKFLTELLKQPNIIITSRPSTKLLPDLDLELEAIGFYPNQVKAYIEADPKMKPIGNEVQSFLQEHWLIQGLVRIPIQLDALCYAWEDFGSGPVPDTMTEMYRAIEQKLWKKDIERLGKKHDGRLVNASQLAPSEIRGLVKHEAYFLEGLAFTGMHSDIINFTSEHHEPISKQFKHSDILLARTLRELSFLRTSDPSSRLEYRSYHFIHLTFQEYFAARYFVRQWEDNKPLEYAFKAQQNNDSDPPSDPVGFVKKYKYSARYDVFWRFVAGLLDADGRANFINIIEYEPLDLLGPTHQRLVMHCLSEISGNLQIREDLEQRLSRWLLFECRNKHTARLASEVEFPDQALHIALREGPDVKKTILRSLTERATLPLSIILHIAARLEDNDRHVRYAAAGAIGRRSDLPKEILAAVAARLEDNDGDVRSVAARALGRRSDLPKEILAAVAARLEDNDRDVRSAAADTLGRRSDLPKEILAAVAARLEDNDRDVRYAAAEALGRRSDLPKEILAAVAARLEDNDGDVRSAAADTLGRRSDLPKEILAAAAARLEDNNRNVRSAAADTLGRRSDLPKEILAAVAARLEDNDRHVRYAAAGAIGRRSDLPKEILAAVAARLEDNNRHVRYVAADTLGRRSDLPKEILAAVAARLEDNDGNVRSAARDVLRHRGKSFLTLLDGPYAIVMYRMLFQESFEEQLSLYIEDGYFCVNMPEGIMRTSIQNLAKDVIATINEARPAELPSRCGSELAGTITPGGTGT